MTCDRYLKSTRNICRILFLCCFGMFFGWRLEEFYLVRNIQHSMRRTDNNKTSSYDKIETQYDQYEKCEVVMNKTRVNESSLTELNSSLQVYSLNDLAHIDSCADFIENRKYVMTSQEEEAEFPLAFSIIMYTSPERAERLLRAIYRPHNFYCIHVDRKSSRLIHSFMNKISSCFHNVFVINKPITVTWGKFSVLQAEIICMEELYKYKWKYFINLTGQEFPLKTNWELVQILKTYNGANDVDATTKM